ncbi:nuclear transport factor 2 family protein [Mesorhizobium sp. BR1-1-16]|uniref:YybH family protein n=1 Tax=Mesorhizobium sp. BR1-1-16 TaxID=2876653 RepID=UPI001CCF6473|nr:SgcJ/EcaC family oxidoreductase [Mesorhizobium sp. BR1-1-16]MBZ9938216.1 nuclear transport factor 2 family protein [Mesorhizobium sp. BR1-1-16]
MSETSTVEDFVEQWVAAFNSRDLDAHMALYTDDALLFGSVDVLHAGRPAVRGYFAGRPPGVRVMRYPMPTVLQLAPDVVATAGHVDFANGEDPMPYRMTWMLVRRDGGWQIAQHHGSPRFGD